MYRVGDKYSGKDGFFDELLQWIAQENLWNLWVPKSHGGLEMSLTNGLETLRSLAKMDGSLGWTITLCSGANFFIGNLQKVVADEIFKGSGTPVFGGSGGVFGTAERFDKGYVINGTWKYATGAPYLTHFTLNAKIRENGSDVLLEDGTPMVRSFLLQKDQVEIIKDWDAMGLRATATYSFRVKYQWVKNKYSFVYDELHLSHPIFKVPFALFADLTLWVNYIGMAEHFLDEAKEIGASGDLLDKLQVVITNAVSSCRTYGKQIQEMIVDDQVFQQQYIDMVHREISNAVQSLSGTMIAVYPILGIRASSVDHPLNQVFRDYFTATQHHIFSPTGMRNQL